jgi:FkbM family methyltransferase
MHPLLDRLKNAVEAATGSRIYRDSLPVGMNLFIDLKRRFTLDDFKVVFDVGANEGQTSAAFQEHFQKASIHAFEPVAAFAGLVREKTAPDRTHVHQFALGSEAGSAFIDVRSNQTSSLVPNPDEPSDRKEEVQIKTVDGFCAEQAIKHIDYLKIDAEGFDMEVLKGARGMLDGKLVSFIQVEAGMTAHWRQIPLCDFVSFLTQYGFELFGLYDQVHCWTGEPWLLCANAVFVHRSMWKPSDATPPAG